MMVDKVVAPVLVIVSVSVLVYYQCPCMCDINNTGIDASTNTLGYTKI